MSASARNTDTGARPWPQILALVFGAVYLLVGIVGFFITGFDDFAGNSQHEMLLFFMIIVIVPMVAVALVLFSITADSETGKADAQIAQGLRAAFAIYDSDRGSARAELARVVRDPRLASALARGDRGAVAARAHALQRQVPGALRLEVYDVNRAVPLSGAYGGSR